MPEEDLERRVAELETALRERKRERRPRGPLGLPRPPTPRELLRAADEHAIPATIASLEATIHALELLRLAIRADDRRRESSERAERIGAAALSRLDDALADARDALEGRPTDEEARRLLAETRRLRDDIESRVRETEGESEAQEGDADDSMDPRVDVESELRSLKEKRNDDSQTGSNR